MERTCWEEGKGQVNKNVGITRAVTTKEGKEEERMVVGRGETARRGRTRGGGRGETGRVVIRGKSQPKARGRKRGGGEKGKGNGRVQGGKAG